MASSTLVAVIKEVAPAVLAVIAVLGGFVLLRVSALYESYLLLFTAFALMVWGIVVLFTGRARSRWPTEDWE